MGAKTLKKLTRLMVFVFFAGCVRMSFGQSETPTCNSDHFFSPEELRADFAEWRSILEESHPGLYRYTSRAELSADFDRVSQSLQHPMNQLQFFSAISPVLGYIKDGHTQLLLPGLCRRYIHEQAKQFPLQLRFNSDHAYVVRTISSAAPPKTEVISINGVPMKQIMKEIGSRLSRDGNIKTGLTWKLSANFSYYYYLFVGQPSKFSLVGVRDKHTQPIVSLDALTELEAKNQASDIPEETPEKPLEYRVLGDGIALLRISTFSESDIADAKQDLPDFLKHSFASINGTKIRDLVIDLRGNDGGSDYGPLFFSYLHRGTFRFFDYFEASTNDLSSLNQWRDQPVSESWTAFTKHFRSSLAKTSGGRYRATTNAYPELLPQQGDPMAYEGKVWFLVDGRTFSATAEFCSVARSYRRGTFVGEETGGAYYGNTSVEVTAFPLKHTRLVIGVPFLKVVMAVRDDLSKARGILPDLVFQPNIDTDEKSELDMVIRTIRDRRG